MSKPIIQLNLDQQLASDKIQEFLNAPYSSQNIFTLTGGPGTGKTFMLKEVLKNRFKDVQAATVSHAAKNILQDSIGDDVVCITISSLLGLAPTILEAGDIKFVHTATGSRNLLGPRSILILDEVSQIDDELYTMITERARTHGVKIIAVGDPYQLPPVEQNHDSRFFDHINATLTIPMRFQGPIADIAQIYRDQINNLNNEQTFDQWALNSKTHRRDQFAGSTGYGFIRNLDDMIDMAVDDIKASSSQSDFSRVLAFKNESVAEINRRIRSKLYGENPYQFEPSEIVICNGGFSVTNTIYKMDQNGDHIPDYSYRRPILHNGQILKVKSFESIIGPDNIPSVVMFFVGDKSSLEDPVITVENSPEGLRKYEEVKNKKLKEALEQKDLGQKAAAWRRYYAFINSFAYFDYAYSVNLYKAQGQTLNNVYVCEGEVMGIKPLTWKQKFQALYVAMTRAKEKLFIYNKEF